MQTLTALFEQHKRLDALLQDLASHGQSDDWRALDEHWCHFERELTAHLDLEEKRILPEFAKAHSVDARDLFSDHAKIRKCLIDVGTAVELHELRADTTSQLITLLRTHTVRENLLMYPWAADHLEQLEAKPSTQESKMEPTKNEFLTTVNELHTLLDEVRVRAHLGGMTARDRFAEINIEAQKLAAASHDATKRMLATVRTFAESLSTIAAP